MIKTGIWAIIVAAAFVVGMIMANPVAEAGGWKDIIDGLIPVDLNPSSTIGGQPIGDISGVFPSFGLTGGGSSGSVSLGINTAVVQQRVVQTCPAGQYIQAIDQFGQVTCGSDQIGRIGSTLVQAASTPANPGFIATVDVFCPPGFVATGGGFQAHPDTNVFRSNPLVNSGGWTVSGQNNGAGPNPVVALARCSTVVP